MTKMNPAGGLLDLIERHRAGRKNTELAAASHGLLNAAAIGNLTNGGLKRFPKPDSLEGYAYALNVPLADVVLAAAVSTGLDARKIGLGSSDDLVLANAGRLPEESRRLLRDTAAQLLWWQERVESEGAGDVTEEPEQIPADDDADATLPGYDLAADDQPEPTAEERERAKLDDLGEENQAGPDDDHVA